MESLKVGICWVKVTYPDQSTIIFRGTKCLEIINQFTSVSVVSPNEIYDVGKKIMRFFTPECEIDVSKLKQEYERRVDQFANQFI